MAHEHSHSHGGSSGPALGTSAALTLLFAAVEAAGGWWTGSLALLSDAAHMATDGAALALGAAAAWVARRPPSARHSYGLGRAEVLAALVNAASMLVIVAFVAYEAFLRFRQPAPVNGAAAAAIALVGLLLNGAILHRLSPHRHDMNARAARLHVLGDALASVVALLSGIVIVVSGWTPVDPLASLVICGLIAASAVRLTRESLHALMEGVPHGLSVDDIGREMASVEGVLSVHDLHVWTLSGTRVALSAHVVVASMAQWDAILSALQQRLREKFRIDHVTLQPESGAKPLIRH